MRAALRVLALAGLLAGIAAPASLAQSPGAPGVGDSYYGNATTAEFISLAEAVSGRDLGRFFDLWLRKRGKPRNWR